MLEETAALLARVVENCPFVEGIDPRKSANRILESAANFKDPDLLPQLKVTVRMLMLLDLLPSKLFSLQIITAAYDSRLAKSIRKRSENNYKDICCQLGQATTNPFASLAMQRFAEEMEYHGVFTNDGNYLTKAFSFDHRIPCCLDSSSSGIDNLWVVTRKLNTILGEITEEQLDPGLEFQQRPFLIVGPNESQGPVFFCNYSPPIEKVNDLRVTLKSLTRARRQVRRQQKLGDQGEVAPI
jgi:hypothetical protein